MPAVIIRLQPLQSLIASNDAVCIYHETGVDVVKVMAHDKTDDFIKGFSKAVERAATGDSLFMKKYSSSPRHNQPKEV